MNWQQLTDRLYVFPDSCNVFAVQGPGGMVIVNAGTGRWLESLAELPARPAALLLTHFFRDHTAGAPAAARAGIPVYAPYWEREQLSDARGLFQRRGSRPARSAWPAALARNPAESSCSAENSSILRERSPASPRSNTTTTT